jgi:glycosyltransferase involved in cell wall biosynthesis
MFDKEIVIVTPWFGRFAGGAESLARGMAQEFNRRGVRTIVFTTCSSSPFESWWEDHYEPGTSRVNDVEVRRFATNKSNTAYLAGLRKIQEDANLTLTEQTEYFKDSINSDDLIQTVESMLSDGHEVVALPYFYGLTHSLLQRYAGEVSLIPCFHDEPQFHWAATGELLRTAKHIFYNSPEEKTMTIRTHGAAGGRRVVEGVVTGVGVELNSNGEAPTPLPDLPKNYFVYAGRKERGKNVPLLCEWFGAYARASRTKAKLLFIGGGDDSLVPNNDNFRDLGFVSETAKRQIIGGAKAMLNLSENESFSIVLMEGWLSGVPVVVSASSPVMKGHVQRSNGGLYVGNQDEFAATLQRLDGDDLLRKRLALQGQEYVAKNFTFDRVLERYLDCLTHETRAAAAS